MTRFNTKRYRCANPACTVEHDLHELVNESIQFVAKQGTKRFSVDVEWAMFTLMVLGDAVKEIERLQGFEDIKQVNARPTMN